LRFVASCEAASLPRAASLTSPDATPGITSWDVLPSITSALSRPDSSWLLI